MYSHQPMRLIFRALAFAADKHRTQRRKDVDESAYINHPIALANVLANEAEIDDPIVICAALLHDTIEDTPTKQGNWRGTSESPLPKSWSKSPTIKTFPRKNANGCKLNMHPSCPRPRNASNSRIKSLISAI